MNDEIGHDAMERQALESTAVTQLRKRGNGHGRVIRQQLDGKRAEALHDDGGRRAAQRRHLRLRRQRCGGIACGERHDGRTTFLRQDFGRERCNHWVGIGEKRPQ